MLRIPQHTAQHSAGTCMCERPLGRLVCILCCCVMDDGTNLLHITKQILTVSLDQHWIIMPRGPIISSMLPSALLNICIMFTPLKITVDQRLTTHGYRQKSDVNFQLLRHICPYIAVSQLVLLFALCSHFHELSSAKNMLRCLWKTSTLFLTGHWLSKSRTHPLWCLQVRTGLQCWLAVK